MSTLEQQIESETDSEAVDKLKTLAAQSEGVWVTVTCTDIRDTQADCLELEFEYHHKHGRITKFFQVPDSPKGSDIKQFLDDVGYSMQNMELLEGAELWYNPNTETFADSPPSWVAKRWIWVKSWWESHMTSDSDRPDTGSVLICVLLAPLIAIVGWIDYLAGNNRRTHYGAMGVGAATMWFLAAIGLYFLTF